jgi:hypothetical protein
LIEIQHVDASPRQAYETIRCASTLALRLADGPSGESG